MLLLLKIAAIWLLIALAAIINGAVRDKLVAPTVGSGIALPLSGFSLALIVFAATYQTLPWLGLRSENDYLLIGSLWVAMTLAFEYLFGHYVMAKSWDDIHDGFNPRGGNLFLMVLLVTAAAPWCAAKLQNLV